MNRATSVVPPALPPAARGFIDTFLQFNTKWSRGHRAHTYNKIYLGHAESMGLCRVTYLLNINLYGAP